MIKCDVCGEPLEYEITILGVRQTIGSTCRCRKKELAEQAERERKQEIKRNRMICFGGSKMKNCTFENSEMTETLRIAENYTKNYIKMHIEGKGLLLYGTVGTGKSHIAACIANRLIDQGQKVLMTNFATIVNQLQSSFDGRQEYINSLNRYSLLILDDLGAERDTQFMQEQIFNVIDARYRNGQPMIITTNLTPEEIKKPTDIGARRIYDRILERCHPVKVDGTSWRRKNLRSDFEEMEAILHGQI